MAIPHPRRRRRPGRRSGTWQARVPALGQMQAYLMRRLGAPEELVREWRAAWNTGDLVRLVSIQNAIIERLAPPPRRDR